MIKFENLDVRFAILEVTESLLVVTAGFYGIKSCYGLSREVWATSGTHFPAWRGARPASPVQSKLYLRSRLGSEGYPSDLVFFCCVWGLLLAAGASARCRELLLYSRASAVFVSHEAPAPSAPPLR